MNYIVKHGETYEIPETTFTIQNISPTDTVELSDDTTFGNGLRLYPQNKMSFDGQTIYARVADDARAVEVRIVPFVLASLGGGGGSGSGTAGPKGAKGDKGDPGQAATIEIGMVTSGASASVTNSGTSTAAVFDFVLPKGDKGDKGDTGETGATGTAGQDGVSPTITSTKADGVTTLTITDATGTSTVTISDGAKGDKGDKGDDGAKGEKGDKGDDGAAATISIGSVTTGATASVVNIGTSTAAIFDFVLPPCTCSSGNGGSNDGYKVMTVKIDQSNSDPETCCSYVDDAVGMTPGSAAWDNFFGHYPAMMLNGIEGQKLNRNNFAQHTDGSIADITGGSEGDAMMAFPRLGLNISTDGDIVTVSMTNNPNDANFDYKAHRRGDTDKAVFYLGVYKGYVDSNKKLRSLSGKTPASDKTITQFRTYAQNNGSGYEQAAFYQILFLQAMYALKYKTLNSQAAVGMGYVDSANYVQANTGGTNSSSMDYGDSAGTKQMKLFGIEDFWGNLWEWTDGAIIDANRHLLTATNNFNSTGSGYIDQGELVSGDTNGYVSKVQGTTELGFTPKEFAGSSSTYFCDDMRVYASKVVQHSGGFSINTRAGAFSFWCNPADYSSESIGSRLMFL